MASLELRERNFLCMLLEKRFGPLHSETLEIIHAADADFFDRIGEALLSSTTIQEVLKKARGMNHRLSQRSDIELQIGKSIFSDI